MLKQGAAVIVKDDNQKGDVVNFYYSDAFKQNVVVVKLTDTLAAKYLEEELIVIDDEPTIVLTMTKYDDATDRIMKRIKESEDASEKIKHAALYTISLAFQELEEELFNGND